MRPYGFKAIFIALAATLVAAQQPFTRPPPIGRFTKRSTLFDGVTFDESVSYLYLGEKDSARLELASSQIVNTNIDFTVKFWFKLAETTNGQVQFWSLPEGVVCNIENGRKISCESNNRQRLVADLEFIGIGKWYYFSMSVTSDGDANLTIWDTVGALAYDVSTEFYVQQSMARGYNICFGRCDLDFKGRNHGFKGGIREVTCLSEHQSQAEIFAQANLQLGYQSKVAGYYRFAKGRFLKEEFRDRTAQLSADADDQPNFDFIPVDICPVSFSSVRMIQFNYGQKVTANGFVKELEQNQYQYTMSTTIFMGDETCATDSLQKAEDDCHIARLEGVFMLYFTSSSLARFHFYAAKNYYESQSASFFLPYNQWVTIQMQMTQYSGYQIAVLDQQGNVLVNFAKIQNMQKQIAKPNLSLFSGLKGFAEEFVLTKTAYYLPQPSSKLMKDAIVNADFYVETRKEITNKGYGKNLSLNLYPYAVSVPIEVAQYKEKFPTRPAFDGVACDDDHYTMQLLNEKAYLRFNTPYQEDWMSETSIQFWFRIDDWSSIDGGDQFSLFTLENPANKFEAFWQIQIRRGELTVAPFGLPKLTDPYVSFDNFKKENQDETGWWHISCWYQFYEKVECTLFNQKSEVTKEESLAGLNNYFIPKYTLQGSFGKTMNQVYSGVQSAQIKEFVFWSRIVDKAEITRNRYYQIDPITTDSLLTYFKLASGIPKVDNLAEKQPTYFFEDTAPQFLYVKWLPSYEDSFVWEYNWAEYEMQNKLVKKFHNVCPVNTYRFEGRCFKEPVNQPVLAIFPEWNKAQNRLDWLLTLAPSTLINDALISRVDSAWSSKQPSLHQILQRKGSNHYERLIDSSLLRNEAEYQIGAGFTNSGNLFWQHQSRGWIPNKCQWMVVGSGDAWSGRSQLNTMPGTQDVYLQLKVKQNTAVDCKNFKFFDKFDSVSFDFVVGGNDGLYMTEKPEVKVFLTTGDYVPSEPLQPLDNDPFTSGRRLQADPATSKDLTVVCTIPKSEQHKIPIWQDVKILMSIKWTSSKYEIEENSHIFQHAMHTIYFNPTARQLQASINSNYNYVQKGQTLILNTNATTVTDLYPEQIEGMLSYEWVCPTGLELLCANQFTSQLFVPWKSVTQVPMTYATLHEFTAKITFTDPEGNKQTETASTKVQWYNIAKPEFNIVPNPKQPLVTSLKPLELAIVGTNFDVLTTDFSIYTVKWSIKPEVSADGISYENDNQKLVIQPGSLAENTEYTVSVEMIFIQEPAIQNFVTSKFKTYSAPSGGSVMVNPPQGYYGETKLVFSIKDWKDKNFKVYYNVFEGVGDSEKWALGLQLNTKGLLTVKESFVHIVNNENVIIIEVKNDIGEAVYTIVRPWIVDRPKQVCEITQDCPEPAPEEPAPAADEAPVEPASGEGRRRLQSAKEKLEAKTRAGSWSESVFDPVDGCTYTKVCTQSEYDWVGQPRGDVELYEYLEYALPKLDVLPEQPQAGRRLESTPKSECSTIADTLRFSTDKLKFQKALETFASNKDMMCILDAVNKQARQEKNIQASAAVLNLVESEYQSSEIDSVLIKVDENAIKDQTVQDVSLFDATYRIEAQAISYLFPARSGQPYIYRVAAVKGVSGETQMKVTIEDTLTNIKYPLNALDGRISLTFALSPFNYIEGQTQCQGLGAEGWSADVCLSEISETTVKCECSLTLGVTAIAFRHDAALVSPMPETHEFKESYTLSVFITAIVLVSMLSTFYLRKQDELDQVKIARLSGWKLQIVQQVADQLNQSLSLTARRQADIIEAYSSEDASHQLWAVVRKVHPMLAPFSSVSETSRANRFVQYMVQCNLVMLAIMFAYGPNYRHGDLLRQPDYLDGKDVQIMQSLAVIGAVFMLPLPQLRSTLAHYLAAIVLAVTAVLLIAGSVLIQRETPVANQLCLVGAISMAAVAGFCLTNMARAFGFAFGQLPYVTPREVGDLIRDIKAVQAVKCAKMEASTEKTLEFSCREPAHTESAPQVDNSLQSVMADVKHLSRKSVV